MKKSLVVMALAASAVEASAFVPSGVASPSVKSMAPAAAAQQVAGKSFDAITTKPATAVALSATGGAAAKTEDDSGNAALKGTLLTGGYFALWYLFNIGYNIYNKQALNVLAYPWTVATIQMATGIPYFCALWALGIRKAPKLSLADLKTLFPVALCHTGVHVGAVVALGAGAVSSFTWWAGCLRGIAAGNRAPFLLQALHLRLDLLQHLLQSGESGVCAGADDVHVGIY